jgi:hypothetical protein
VQGHGDSVGRAEPWSGSRDRRRGAETGGDDADFVN